jgi:Tfp pilus assembly protein PilF
LNVTALTDQADFEDLAGNPSAARDLYRKALALEPQNASVWYAYGVFWWSHKNAQAALAALNEAYVYDNYGVVGTKCGYLDRAKRAVLGTPLPTCPGR